MDDFVVVSRPEFLTYSIVTNSNTTAVTAAITDNRLVLTANQAGTAVITVRATDQSGAFVEDTFTVTVS